MTQNQFSVYSPLDGIVVKICISHHCFLIGGTALEILMNFHHLKFNRNRSENDFDFVMRISFLSYSIYHRFSSKSIIRKIGRNEIFSYISAVFQAN